MGCCVKCKEFLPPGFLIEKEKGDLLCLFCERGMDEIRYGENKEKVASKTEVVKEYGKFLKMVKVDNDVLKKAAKGEGEDVPGPIII